MFRAHKQKRMGGSDLFASIVACGSQLRRRRRRRLQNGGQQMLAQCSQQTINFPWQLNHKVGKFVAASRSLSPSLVSVNHFLAAAYQVFHLIIALNSRSLSLAAPAVRQRLSFASGARPTGPAAFVTLLASGAESQTKP